MTESLAKTYEDVIREKNKQSQDFRRYITWQSPGDFITKYLGCDIIFIREWLESRFLEGMSWDNYGQIWVVDHIVPFRSFNLFHESDLYLLWNYRNLMPLFSEDNSKKQGNVFYAFELLFPVKDKDRFYCGLFEKIRPEVEWMVKYIDKYHS